MTKARAVMWMVVVTLGCSDCSCRDESSNSNPPSTRKPSNQKPIGCRFNVGDTDGTGTDGVQGKYTFVGAPTFDDPQQEAVHPTVLGGEQTLGFVADTPGPAVRPQSTAGTFTEITPLGAVFHATVAGYSDIDLYASGTYVDSLWHRIVSSATGTLRIGQVSSLPPAVLAGRSLPMAVQLAASDGTDVVDETVVVSAIGSASLVHDIKAWYRWTAKAGAVGTPLQLKLKSKGVVGTPLEVAVVDAVDGLATTADPIFAGGLLAAGDELDFCPYTTAGAGAYELVAAGSVDVDAEGAIDVNKNPSTGCYRIYPTGFGGATLTLTWNDLQRVYALYVGDLDMGAPDLGASVDMSQVD